MLVESIGICASLLILFSMSRKLESLKQQIMLRIFNSIGSILFVVYGLVIPAYSTAFLNLASVVINVRYLIPLIRDYRKDKNQIKNRAIS